MQEEYRIKTLKRQAKENLTKNFELLTPDLYKIAQKISCV